MIKTEVLQRGQAQFDMCGKFLGYPLREIDEQISSGLVERLVRYASQRLHTVGLAHTVSGWQLTVGTTDGDEKPSERSYYVTWRNPEQTEISLAGILTRAGWPFIDHGFSMETGVPE